MMNHTHTSTVKPFKLPTTPETAAACQMLFHAADTASPRGQRIAFEAIAHLTQRSVTSIRATWEATR